MYFDPFFLTIILFETLYLEMILSTRTWDFGLLIAGSELTVHSFMLG